MAALRAAVLCVNAGSSSLKLAVWTPDGAALVRGAVEDIGEPESRVWFRDASGRVVVDERHRVAHHEAGADLALGMLDRLETHSIAAVGHRLVHGGTRFVAPTVVDDGVLDELKTLVPLAPLHLPPQIAALEAMARRTRDLPQVACFDTAFHRRMPEIAQRFPLPEWAWEAGILRFGFHGLSYEHVMDVLGPDSGRVVIAHLGNGASMAAVYDGAPIDTTMAFTPTAGLMMGSRTGDLDPGLVVHLLRDRNLDADDLDRLVNHESGLLGVSGATGDMAELLDVRDRDERADRAVTMFCRTARKAIGALAATIHGMDQLVFTGGIGEHAAPVRAQICAGLDHLGVILHPTLNDGAAPIISMADAPCTVRIIPADEERVIARHTWSTVQGSPSAG